MRAADKPSGGTRDPLVVTIVRDDTAVVVMLGGDVRPHVYELRRLLADLIEGQGNLRVVLDACRVKPSEDGQLLTVIAEAASLARKRGGAVTMRRTCIPGAPPPTPAVDTECFPVPPVTEARSDGRCDHAEAFARPLVSSATAPRAL